MVQGAADCCSAQPQDGASTAHRLSGGGSVWANQLCGSKQLEQGGEGLGSCLCLHHDSSGTSGDDAVLFYRLIPDGPEEVQGPMHGAPRRFQSNQGDQLVAADYDIGLVRGG